MMHDTLAAALVNIKNSEKVGKTKCIVKPSSKTIKSVLDLMKKNKYIKDFKEIKDGKGDMIDVILTGAINKVGAIKPRFSVNKDEFEKFEKRYLIAKDFGFIMVSTSKGIMTHQEAKEKGLGGVLLAYCY